MSSPYLTTDELRALTCKQRSKAQKRVLDFMGIECRSRPDGTLAVLRSEVDRQLGSGQVRSKPVAEPNWGAI